MPALEMLSTILSLGLDTSLFAIYSVVFSRGNNENSNSALDPVCLLHDAEEKGMDLSRKASFCVNADFDMLVECDVYEVLTVVLPAWLSFEEWRGNNIAWDFAWSRGVDYTWPEHWQRALLKFSSVQQVGAVSLLTTKSFRNNFRASMKEQLVKWLDTPESERKYNSPFSWKQWDCVCNSYVALDAKRTDNDVYYTRRYHTDRGLAVRLENRLAFQKSKEEEKANKKRAKQSA